MRKTARGIPALARRRRVTSAGVLFRLRFSVYDFVHDGVCPGVRWRSFDHTTFAANTTSHRFGRHRTGMRERAVLCSGVHALNLKRCCLTVYI